MPQSLNCVYLHLVFSTKNRIPFITEEVEAELYAYLSGSFKQQGCPAKLINGTADHIHTLFSLSRTRTIADVVGSIKSSSTKWIEAKPGFRDFSWQAGYGVFSVGQANLVTASNYIRNQKERHKRLSFQNEYRGLLKRAGIEYDEQYVWD